MTRWEHHLLVAGYIAALWDYGYSVESVTRFEDIPDLAKRTGRDYQMPGFAPNRVDLTETRAFWLFLKDGDDYIGSAASILQDLGTETLDRYLDRTMQSHFPHPTGKTLLNIATPISEYSGRLGYMGELHFQPGHRGKRDVIKNFIRLMVALISHEWDLDYIYAFVSQRQIIARLDLIYGFTRCLEQGQLWNLPEPEVRTSTEWFVASSRSEIEHNLSVDLKRIYPRNSSQ